MQQRFVEGLKTSVTVAALMLSLPWNDASAGGPPLCPNVVPNLPTGCNVTTIPGVNKSYSYCHKNISDIPQYCPGSAPYGTGAGCAASVPAKGVWNVPGMECGGAVPLLDPIPVAAADLLPACPPDNWCINAASAVNAYGDGSLHINDGAPAGTYNLTLSMGQNYLYVRDVARTYSLPPMGTCAEKFAGSTGTLLLSMGYSYMITPSSVLMNDGSNCYGLFKYLNGVNTGTSCDYSDPDLSPAPHPVDYTTAFSPYAAINTVNPSVYGGNPDTIPPTPGKTLPYINVTPGAQIWLSLKIPGRVRLPEGGMVITSTGGMLAIPPRGEIVAVGDGSTVNLSPTAASPVIAYLLDTPVSAVPNEVKLNVVTQTPCYVQLVPPDGAQQVTKCSNTIPTALPIDMVPNPAIMILATGLQVPDDTPLPVFTLGDSCVPADAKMEGSIITPQFCKSPEIFDAYSQECVELKPECDGGTPPLNYPYNGPLPPAPGAGAYCPPAGGVPVGDQLCGVGATNPDGTPKPCPFSDGRTYECFNGSALLSCRVDGSCGVGGLHCWSIGCSGDNSCDVCMGKSGGSSIDEDGITCGYAPCTQGLRCSVQNYVWCENLQGCIWGDIGNEPSICGAIPADGMVCPPNPGYCEGGGASCDIAGGS